jgi:hypothetical protein
VILETLPETFAICRLAPADPIPNWATGGTFSSIVRTDRELSIVVRAENVPDGVSCERGWRAARFQGILDFSQVGILASICAPLAAANIPVFAVSTYDTDYLFVRSEDWDAATAIFAMSHTLAPL